MAEGTIKQLGMPATSPPDKVMPGRLRMAAAHLEPALPPFVCREAATDRQVVPSGEGSEKERPKSRWREGGVGAPSNTY